MKNKIEEFCEYLLRERMFSSNTVMAYHNDLNAFSFYLEEHHEDYLVLTKENIRDYLKYLSDNHFTSKSIARHLSSLRSFYNYLVQNKVLLKNIFLEIHNPKLGRPLPNILNQEEREQLLSFPNLETVWDKERYLILELLYSTGLRVSELSNIKLNDIKRKEQTIYTVGKGKKERVVYFGEVALEALNDYLDVRDNLLKKEKHDYLFVNQKGGKLSRASIEKIVQKRAFEANLMQHVSPHTLRHTYATDMLSNGADIRTVQELLGHEKLSTTEIYTHLSSSYLKEEYRHKMIRK